MKRTNDGNIFHETRWNLVELATLTAPVRFAVGY